MEEAAPATKIDGLLCTNCGKTGKHGWCKEVFSVEKRIQIDSDVRILQEERARLNKQARDAEKLCKKCAGARRTPNQDPYRVPRERQSSLTGLGRHVS